MASAQVIFCIFCRANRAPAPPCGVAAEAVWMVRLDGAMKKSERTRALLRESGEHDLDPHIVSYFELFNEGRYYQAHDVLEALWLPIRGSKEGDYFKGLIQLAGVFVLLSKGRVDPASRLLQRVRFQLRLHSGLVHGLDAGQTLELVEEWESHLKQGQAIEAFERGKPRLSWVGAS